MYIFNDCKCIEWQGRFKEVVDVYIEVGQMGMVMEMYFDFCMFEEVKVFVVVENELWFEVIDIVIIIFIKREVDVQEII